MIARIQYMRKKDFRDSCTLYKSLGYKMVETYEGFQIYISRLIFYSF